VCGSDEIVCSLSLLIRGAQRARCQAETPLIALFRFSRPALISPNGQSGSGRRASSRN